MPRSVREPPNGSGALRAPGSAQSSADTAASRPGGAAPGRQRRAERRAAGRPREERGGRSVSAVAKHVGGSRRIPRSRRCAARRRFLAVPPGPGTAERLGPSARPRPSGSSRRHAAVPGPARRRAGSADKADASNSSPPRSAGLRRAGTAAPVRRPSALRASPLHRLLPAAGQASAGGRRDGPGRSSRGAELGGRSPRGRAGAAGPGADNERRPRRRYVTARGAGPGGAGGGSGAAGRGGGRGPGGPEPSRSFAAASAGRSAPCGAASAGSAVVGRSEEGVSAILGERGSGAAGGNCVLGERNGTERRAAEGTGMGTGEAGSGSGPELCGRMERRPSARPEVRSSAAVPPPLPVPKRVQLPQFATRRGRNVGRMAPECGGKFILKGCPTTCRL